MRTLLCFFFLEKKMRFQIEVRNTKKRVSAFLFFSFFLFVSLSLLRERKKERTRGKQGITCLFSFSSPLAQERSFEAACGSGDGSRRRSEERHRRHRRR